MMRDTRLAALLALFLIPGGGVAQPVINAQWMWFNDGDPAKDAAPGKVWFRRYVSASEPSTGAIQIACDDHFVLWVNGRKIGEGGGMQSYRFNLNGIVDRGVNVIAVEATNEKGTAGLFIDGEVREQTSRSHPFDSGSEWKATRVAPEGTAWLSPDFEESKWVPVKVLGPHGDSPWKAITFGEGLLDRFQVAAGFELQRVAEPDLVGSVVAITWGNRGRLIASKERGPIQSLIDENGDGVYDRKIDYSDKVTNCQGLCTVLDDLYAVGDGPDGTGLYRLPDADHDDRDDSVEPLSKFKGGMGEHGPHDVIYGPDGWLYMNLGNHAWVTNEPLPNSPCSRLYEGDLLQPRLEDAHGHAAGIKIPGGTIWRFTPDGKKWWMEVNGFRNHYDFAFQRQGEMFTFDSDMEWDVGEPWYRPVRVNHCIPGAEFGWRSGIAKWPVHYFDSLPGTANIGRGSPTGIVFYEHLRAPERYRGSLLVCDWSIGRIIAVFLEPHGASYKSTWEDLVSGNPLNVSDIEVDRDGSIVFATGGRNTEGGIYRVRHKEFKASPIPAETVDDALRIPQIGSAWAREMARSIQSKQKETWERDLIHAVRTGTREQKLQGLTLMCQLGPKPTEAILIERSKDADAQVRAMATFLLADHPGPGASEALAERLVDADPRVRRRACEAYVRGGMEPPVTPLLDIIASGDRWLAFAGRLALERVPAVKWRDAVLSSENPRVNLVGLLALHRLGDEALRPNDALRKELALLERADRLDPASQVDLLRMIELSLQRGAKGPETARIGLLLLERFAGKDDPVSMESARLLAYLQVEKALPLLLDALAPTNSHAQQIHFALCLRSLHVGWDLASWTRLMQWYEGTQRWEGGHSFGPYLANIISAGFDHLSPDVGRELILGYKQNPFASRLVLERADPARIANHVALMKQLLDDLLSSGSPGVDEERIGSIVDSLGKNSSSESQALLRSLFDQYPDRRGRIAVNLAKTPSPDNWPYLVRSLQFGENATLQQCVSALRRIDRRPEKPEEIRTAILVGLELGDRGGLAAAELLSHWTGVKHDAGRDANAAVAFYQKWFKENYPKEPAPELPPQDANRTKFTYQQLVDYLAKPEHAGNVERGKAVFTKANCVKCHRFLNDGEGLGPDLTTVRRRFQRKEIIESLVLPSKVISDQYRGVTVATADGQIYSGLQVPQGDESKLVLVLPNATRMTLSKADVESTTPSRVSIMPEDVLKELSLDEVADLFAFLETSKSNAEPLPAGGSQ